jgi:hypothetical protein
LNISGEFDQPETIWSNEMRRLMIEKIAVHLGKLQFVLFNKRKPFDLF